MRTAFAFATLLGTAALALSQERPKQPEEVPPRFGLPYRPKAYPQATPKQALESAIAATEKGDVNYLVAHLLDPTFVDARLADRGKLFERTVEAELIKLRDIQRKNPDNYPVDVQVPEQPAKFQARVEADARARAFAQLVRDVQAKLIDDPEVLKDLRKFNRQGTFPEAGATGDTVKVGLPDVKDRAVFLKKIGDRWYIENRQVEEKEPGKKEPEPKKE